MREVSAILFSPSFPQAFLFPSLFQPFIAKIILESNFSLLRKYFELLRKSATPQLIIVFQAAILSDPEQKTFLPNPTLPFWKRSPP